MSEHFFGVGNGKVSSSRADKIDRVARKHGASFVAVNMPDGPRYWFACDHRGEPFNRHTVDAVFAAVEAAGLWPPESEL